jgi:ATP-dependent helicase HrpB
MAQGLRRMSELRAMDLVHTLRGEWGPLAARVDALAPERIALPSGRSAAVHYEAGKPPWAESHLQDFFGQRTTPRVGEGRVPLTLHLLAPNKRAVQVTQDLEGFWERHYPAVRKELMRKYPRHFWPESPLEAEPKLRVARKG